MDVDQTDGLCEKCRQPFTDWAHVVETCKGGSESIYSHHNLSTLKDSVTEGCTMCLMFLNEVSRQISSFTPEARRVMNTLHGQLTIHPNRTTFKFDIAQVRSWNVGLKFVPPRLSVLAMLTLTPTDQKGRSPNSV